MCTVTLIPTDSHSTGSKTRAACHGLRVLCNRDEARTKTPAIPPRAVAIENVHAIMPTDPGSGGTWVAVNDAGLFMTLLNRNDQDRRGEAWATQRQSKASRGQIIPSLIAAQRFEQALETASQIDASQTLPFRLVLADMHQAAVVSGDGNTLALEQRFEITQPWMITSSGMGDGLVEPPRRELFNNWFGSDASAWPAQQDAFHEHRWPGREPLSVNMSRDDAMTLSVTRVVLQHDAVKMVYHGAPPREPFDDVEVVLPSNAAALERSP